MRQPAYPGRDRRSDPRQPMAFAFWIRPVGSAARHSAWLLDVSAGGAACLVPADQVPAVGRRVEFVEMPTIDPLVRAGTLLLPAFARVLRHDEQEGLTRRVAVRFETDAQAPLDTRRDRAALARRPRVRAALPAPPPVPAAKPVGDILRR